MKKKHLKAIAQVAAELPTVTQQSFERHLVKGSTLLAQGQVIGHDDKPIVPTDGYFDEFPVIMAINHKRRMKKLFKKHGEAGIFGYIQAIENHIEEHPENLHES